MYVGGGSALGSLFQSLTAMTYGSELFIMLGCPNTIALHCDSISLHRVFFLFSFLFSI